MARINDIKNIIQAQAAAAQKNNVPTASYGNNALKVAEPVIPLPTATPSLNKNKAPAINSRSVQSTPKQELKTWIRTNLKEGRDYGNLPGIPRPVLLKHGAVRIMNHLNLTMDVSLLDSVVTTDGTPSFTITVKVTLISPENRPVVSSLGTASTLEKKAGGINSIPTVTQQATKRALVNAIKTICVTD